jgi:hypothetical protein
VGKIDVEVLASRFLINWSMKSSIPAVDEEALNEVAGRTARGVCSTLYRTLYSINCLGGQLEGDEQVNVALTIFSNSFFALVTSLSVQAA